MKGALRRRESSDSSACRGRERKRFGPDPHSHSGPNQGSSKRIQSRNVVPVKSRICLLPANWEGVSFSIHSLVSAKILG